MAAQYRHGAATVRKRVDAGSCAYEMTGTAYQYVDKLGMDTKTLQSSARHLDLLVLKIASRVVKPFDRLETLRSHV
jgi:uncharacterized membrane protein